MEKYKLQMQIKAISANIQDKYQVEIEELKSDLPTDKDTKDVSRFELVSHIEKFKKEIGDMGMVNMKAISAYQEHKEREIFLGNKEGMPIGEITKILGKYLSGYPEN